MKLKLSKFVVNVKKDKYDVYIGRPSKWGNPFSHLPNSKAEFLVDSKEEAIEKFKEWLLTQPELIEEGKKVLKEKRLGCFCRPGWCHGDVWSEIVNPEE